MRTIIVLAIGIYIGKQLCKSYEAGKYQAIIRPRLLKLFQSRGITREEAENELEKVFS